MNTKPLLRADLQPGDVYRYISSMTRGYPEEIYAVDNIRISGAPVAKMQEKFPTLSSPVELIWKASVPLPAPHAQSHYQMSPEPIEVMEKWFPGNLLRAFALKYMARAGKKGTKADHIRDLEKCISYLKREINALNGISAW